MTPNKLILQTRRPSKDYSDPGAVEIGYWIESDGKVYQTDENGNKTGQSRTLPEGADPKNLAIRMLRERVNTKRVSYNRPLVYPKHYY
jgi:hypothetical protein